MIRISVVVPTYNRPRELRLCLEGFAAQTAPRDSFEVIVIDDGSRESMESLVAEFSASINVVFRHIENSGPSGARNVAIDLAAAPLLLLYDDDLCPLPGMISYCLNFHAEHSGESNAALLWFMPAEPLRNDPLVEALFPRMYPFPAGPANRGTFWSGSLTCKKSIFRFGRFSEEFRALEDWELEIRLRRAIDLDIFLERQPLGLYTRPLTLAQFFSRSYGFGYYDYWLARAHPAIRGDVPASYPDGELISHSEIPSLLATLKVFIARRPTRDSPLFRMLQALLSRLEAHARADGWKTARDGGAAAPPGSLGGLVD